MNAIIPKQYVPYAILAGLIVLMALIVWLGIFPVRSIIAERMDDIQRIYTIRENRERQVARLPELETQFQTIEAGADTMRILLPEDSIVDFVKTLEGLAEESGVKISIESKESSAIVDKKTAKPTASKTSASSDSDAPATKDQKAPPTIMDALPYDRYLHISVSLQGEYADIIRFLHRMETLPYGLDVVGLDVQVNTDTEKRSSSVPEPGRNPFMLVPSGNAQESGVAPDAGAASQDGKQYPIKADFDTVVYIKK